MCSLAYVVGSGGIGAHIHIIIAAGFYVTQNDRIRGALGFHSIDYRCEVTDSMERRVASLLKCRRSDARRRVQSFNAGTPVAASSALGRNKANGRFVQRQDPPSYARSTVPVYEDDGLRRGLPRWTQFVALSKQRLACAQDSPQTTPWTPGDPVSRCYDVLRVGSLHGEDETGTKAICDKRLMWYIRPWLRGLAKLLGSEVAHIEAARKGRTGRAAAVEAECENWEPAYVFLTHYAEGRLRGLKVHQDKHTRRGAVCVALEGCDSTEGPFFVTPSSTGPQFDVLLASGMAVAFANNVCHGVKAAMRTRPRIALNIFF